MSSAASSLGRSTLLFATFLIPALLVLSSSPALLWFLIAPGLLILLALPTGRITGAVGFFVALLGVGLIGIGHGEPPFPRFRSTGASHIDNQ